MIGFERMPPSDVTLGKVYISVREITLRNEHPQMIVIEAVEHYRFSGNQNIKGDTLKKIIIFNLSYVICICNSVLQLLPKVNKYISNWLEPQTTPP